MINFPCSDSIRYAFGRLRGNGDTRNIASVFVDTNSLYPPTGSKIYESQRRGSLFSAFESTVDFHDIEPTDTDTRISIIDGVEEMARVYRQDFSRFCRNYGKAVITEEVREEMRRSIAYAELKLSEFLDETKPAQMDMRLWRRIKSLLEYQTEYVRGLVEGVNSILTTFESRGVRKPTDKHRALQRYLLDNRKRYGLEGTTKGVDEMLVAHAILESVDRGQCVRVYSADRAIPIELFGLLGDCLSEPGKLNGLHARDIQAALTNPQSAVSVHWMGYMGDMMVSLDTSQTREDPLKPRVMGNWRAAKIHRNRRHRN